MLIEASHPLARPAPAHDDASPGIDRWVLASSEALDLLRSDTVAADVLDGVGAFTLPFPDDEAVVFFSAEHGFPAQAIRKMLRIRSEGLRGRVRVSAEEDPVSLESLASGPMEPELRTLVLALQLGVVERDDDGVHVTEAMRLPGDLVEAVRTITTDARLRPAREILAARIDDRLADAAGIDRLRQAAEEAGLSPVERRILLETLAEILPEQDPTEPQKVPVEPR
ncbi:MAG TPA: hypothetical protein VF212_17945 [Longimicrobiales bacterium]